MQKNIKKIVSLMLAALLLFSVFAVNVSAATPKISKTAASVVVGKTVTLKVTGYSKTVKWASSNKTIATVSSKGVVKGITVGTATVTATAGSKKLTCKITVKSNVIPTGAKEYNGHTYYLYSGKYTWTKAKALCEAKGGHLVTITSSAEQKFVQKLVQKTGKADFWIGATDSAKEGTWKWVTGEAFKYANWQTNMPDGGNNENYLEIWGADNNYHWNDCADIGRSGYICEWDTTKAKASAYKFTSSTASVTYGATKTLKVINTVATPTWTSSNTSIATVSSKGVVTGKALGKAVISARVGKKIVKCTVTVKDANAAASVSFKSSNGGIFVKGFTATATFKPKAKCAKAVATVVNASGTKLYSKTFTKLAKDTAYSFTWNGQKSDGSYASAGSYRVKVVIGTKTSYSSYLKFESTNPFAGGNGAKSNPFQIKTVAQFRKIGKYPTASFKQMANLDFGYSAVSTMFSDDNPYSGTYDGNGKTISNITNTAPIFRSIGKNGVLKNAKFDNCVANSSDTVNGTGVSVITHVNYGKIENCIFNCFASKALHEDCAYAGIVTFYNHGVISGCELNGKSNATDGVYTSGIHKDVYTGAFAFQNLSDGKIISCVSHADVQSNGYYYEYTGSGGIVNDNFGTIVDCEADGMLAGKRCGGIASINSGNIQMSSYTGSSAVPLVYENRGSIIQ